MSLRVKRPDWTGLLNTSTIYVQELMTISSKSTKVNFTIDDIPWTLPLLIYMSCQHGKAKRKKDDESENSSEEEQPKKKAKRKSKVRLCPCVAYICSSELLLATEGC
jgi:hypothetical protein